MTDGNTPPDSAGPIAIPRRTAVAGLVTIAGMATACTRYGNTTTAPTGNDPGGDSGGGSAGGATLNTSEVPVGGGALFKNEQVVVTQPTPGTFKAFSAVCTHQGCIVNDVAGGTINCTCHGSKFRIDDGSVVNGPASTPLPQRSVTITGDQITLA